MEPTSPFAFTCSSAESTLKMPKRESFLTLMEKPAGMVTEEYVVPTMTSPGYVLTVSTARSTLKILLIRFVAAAEALTLH